MDPLGTIGTAAGSGRAARRRRWRRREFTRRRWHAECPARQGEDSRSLQPESRRPETHAGRQRQVSAATGAGREPERRGACAGRGQVDPCLGVAPAQTAQRGRERRQPISVGRVGSRRSGVAAVGRIAPPVHADRAGLAAAAEFRFPRPARPARLRAHRQGLEVVRRLRHGQAAGARVHRAGLSAAIEVRRLGIAAFDERQPAHLGGVAQPAGLPAGDRARAARPVAASGQPQ